MSRVRSPALISSAAAPVLLFGGWLLAESRQPPGFDPVRDTISDLAALGATDREIMTLALIGVGLAHCITAYCLSEAARAGRALLGVGGVATVLVAAFPLPAGGGSSAAHTSAATAAFAALALWPWFSSRPGATTLLRPVASRIAGAVLLALVGWFGLTLWWAGGGLGLAERTAAAAQALWPLLVVLGVVRAR